MTADTGRFRAVLFPTENPGVGSSILPLSTISFARQTPKSRAGAGVSSLLVPRVPWDAV
jgi:hypothetical protein